MNKKVLTLCAGFMLAGGMLSTVSAEKLSDVAGNGKYYKMLRIGQKQSGNTANQFQTNTEGFSLEYVNGKLSIDNDATNGVDYWKVSGTAADGFVLTNQDGKTLSVKTQNVNQNGVVGEEYTNLDQNQWYVIKWQIGDVTPYALIPVAGTEYNAQSYYYSAAFDSQATNLQEVAGYDAVDFFTAKGKTYMADGKTYRMYYTLPMTGAAHLITGIMKAAYNQQLGTWSFTNNETGAQMTFGDEVDFELVKVGDDVIFKLPSDKGYLACNSNVFEIVTSIEDATVFAFQITKERVPVTVGVLNYYEKDGFSIEITSDNKALAGDEFVGHLTPMTFDWDVIGGNDKNGKFIPAAEGAREFYLKNADGKYIVAIPYDVEVEDPRESLYHFTTVTADELRHNLQRAWNDNLGDKQECFGRFRASVDEAALAQDPTKLKELTWLEVNVANFADVATYEYATVGRADIKKVPTLVAACEGYVGTTLKDIHIKLGSGQVANWQEVLQPKFFTVEKYNAAGDKLEGKLTASGLFETEFRKTKPGNELECQFALTINDENEYVFANRETPTAVWTQIPVSALYTTDKNFTYKWGNNVYVIKPVAEVDEADGYVRFSDSQLNREYRIAYSSAVFGNVAYLTENHDDAKDAEFHTIGLNPEEENALVFNIKKYNAPRYINNELGDENADHTYNYHPTDSIYVVSTLGYYNTNTGKQAFKQDTLKVLAYTFVNQFNEPMQGLQQTDASTAEDYAFVSDVYKTGKEKYASVSEAHANAIKFVVREDNGKQNLRPLYDWKNSFKETEYNKSKTSKDLYQEFQIRYEGEYAYTDDYMKMYAGDALNGILANVFMYDRTENDLFTIEETESEVYRRLASNDVDTVSIFRNENEKALLYEKTTEIADDVFVNFLGLENIADFTNMEPAMLADTAYIRNNTYKPQYLLAVNPTIHPAGRWCAEHQSATCEHAVPTPAWTEGRFLVNLVDSAKAWDEAHKHQLGNPYKNTEGFYKLGFVQATHRNDSLIVNGKPQFIGNNDNHIAKFQFRYVDTADKSFVIETSFDGTQTPGYLKWMNGVVVAIKDIKNADVYNMNEDESRTPTANEEINAEGNVVVAGVNGAVVVKGAEGKNVIVSTILGKVVANKVVSSDNATIAAPAGIVVVSVDGESFKVVVK